MKTLTGQSNKISRITVFTPTYNRGYLIDKLYQSLLSQTRKDFEWLVVDDGSTDGTESFFQELLQNSPAFPIRYYKKENGGKHRAINYAMPLAEGELFFIVDSDDTLVSDAIEKLFRWADSLDGTKKWAGVSGLRGRTETEALGERNSKSEYVDAKCKERIKFHLTGDHAEAYFTEVLRKYPFPEFEGERFVVEDTVWNRIACDGYYLRWFDEIIYICEYLEDGLTHRFFQLLRDNPQGTSAWLQVQRMAFPRFSAGWWLTVRMYYRIFSGTKTDREIAGDLGVPSLVIKGLKAVISLKRKIKR